MTDEKREWGAIMKAMDGIEAGKGRGLLDKGMTYGNRRWWKRQSGRRGGGGVGKQGVKKKDG